VYKKVLPGGVLRWVDAKFYATTRVGNPEAVEDVIVLERDVTDDLEKLHQAAEDGEKFRDLAENQHDVLFSLDLQGHFTLLTFSAYTQWGYRPEELIGRSCWGMLKPENRVSAEYFVRDVVDRRAPNPNQPFVVERACKNGTYTKEEIRLSLKLNPLTNAPLSLNGVSRKVCLFVCLFVCCQTFISTSRPPRSKERWHLRPQTFQQILM